ncbi:TetR/AcrR family transcriptional regulator [Streptomyces sp. NPDC004111]|uniref:TetR/AcrR family transcriptional regulator n=1 Tax=Streptomyces sp. NPDC004111 TaxID=3364690 RepID=UPI0036A7E9D1
MAEGRGRATRAHAAEPASGAENGAPGGGAHGGTRGSARGSYAVGDARRRRILDTAVEHFARWGFHASSMARIAHDCGITQGGLLHHFRSKEDLLLHVLAQSERHDVQQLFATAPASVAEGFAALVRLAGANTRRPGPVRMFNVLVGEAGNPGHPAHRYFRDRYARVLGHTADLLEAGIARGEIRPDLDVRACAQEQIAVMDGLQLQWALDESALDMPGRLREYLDRTLRHITVDGSGLPAA